MTGKFAEVKAGQVWRHHKGRFYEILYVAIDELAKGVIVVYRGVGENEMLPWARSLESFTGNAATESFHPSTLRQFPRFELVAESVEEWELGLGKRIDEVADSAARKLKARGEEMCAVEIKVGSALEPMPGMFCPACGQPQFKCPSGITCKNGHGY